MRDALTKSYTIRLYKKNTVLDAYAIQSAVCLLIDGLLIATQSMPGDEERRVTTDIFTGESILTLTPGAQRTPNPIEKYVCVTDCAIVFLDNAVYEHYFATDIAFVHAVFDHLLAFSAKKTRLVRDIAFADAQTAVRNVLAACRENHLPRLTHEQIALLCNLRRPTVTSMIRKLQRTNPELFDRRDV